MPPQLVMNPKLFSQSNKWFMGACVEQALKQASFLSFQLTLFQPFTPTHWDPFVISYHLPSSFVPPVKNFPVMTTRNQEAPG